MVNNKSVGIIGYSQGNGHPFSFSAIINGFNRNYFNLNPVKPINDYLVEQPEELFGIDDWIVTHIWCQDKKLSESIAKFAKIENVVDHYKDMLKHIDILLVLRDDLHQEISEIFLDEGKYVFIDKPLALTKKSLDYFRPFLDSGQLMSCSGLRFLPQLEKLNQRGLKKKLDLEFAYCTTASSWENYGIHSLEGLSPVFGFDYSYVQYVEGFPGQAYLVQLKNRNSILINCSSNHCGGIRSHIYSKSNQPIEIIYNDNFNSFRNTLMRFNHQIKEGKPTIDPRETISLLKVIIGGQKSKKLKGEKVFLDEE